MKHWILTTAYGSSKCVSVSRTAFISKMCEYGYDGYKFYKTIKHRSADNKVTWLAPYVALFIGDKPPQ